jgi:hypothetical protein
MRHRSGLPALLALVTTGCSLVMVKGPPRGHETMAEFTCTEGRTLPWIDAGTAALLGGLTIAIAATPESEPASGSFTVGPDRSDAMLWLSIPAVALGASSAIGFHRTGECRAALEELRQREPIPTPSSMPFPRIRDFER